MPISFNASGFGFGKLAVCAPRALRADRGDFCGAARKNPDVISAPAFRFVERFVGRPEQGLGFLGMIGEDRDAERRGDAHQIVALLPNGRADRFAFAAGALESRIWQYQRELLAPVAAGDVATTN